MRHHTPKHEVNFLKMDRTRGDANTLYCVLDIQGLCTRLEFAFLVPLGHVHKIRSHFWGGGARRGGVSNTVTKYNMEVGILKKMWRSQFIIEIIFDIIISKYYTYFCCYLPYIMYGRGGYHLWRIDRGVAENVP